MFAAADFAYSDTSVFCACMWLFQLYGIVLLVEA